MLDLRHDGIRIAAVLPGTGFGGVGHGVDKQIIAGTPKLTPP